MTLRSTLTPLALAVSTLLLVGACGGDDPKKDDEGKKEQKQEETEDTELSESDLEEALLQLEDLEGIEDGFAEESQDEEGFTGDDIIDGPQACKDFYDKSYGPDPENKVKTGYATSTEEQDLGIFSTIEAYGEGEAEEELEALRDIFEECSTFAIDYEGTRIDVSASIIELPELSSDYDLGDEGVAVALDFTAEGQTFVRQGYTLVRIGDVLTISGASSTLGLGDAIMLPITEAAAERLETLLDEKA